jgi:hypothetical protein
MTKKESAAGAEDTDKPLPTYEGPVLTIMRMDGVKEGAKINGFKTGKGAPGDFDKGE